MNYKIIPLAFALVFLLVPPMNSYASDPLSFDSSETLNEFDYGIPIHQASSEENGMHWVYNDDENTDELYYVNSLTGALSTPILIRDIEGTSSPVSYRANVYLDGETVIVSYGLYDSSTFYYSIAMKKSTDNGATFGSEISISGTNGIGEDLEYVDYYGESHFIKKSDADGDLFMFYSCEYCDDADQNDGIYDERQVGVFHSDDDGASWDFQSIVSGFEYDTYYDYYAILQAKGVVIEGDTIYMAINGYEGDDGYYSVYIQQSDDDGETWEWGETGNNENQLLQVDWFDYDTYIPAQLFKAGENFLIVYRLYEYEIYAVTSSDFVTFTNLDEYGCNDSGMEHCGAGDAEPDPIDQVCSSYDDDHDWDAEQLGSFIAILYSCGGYEDEDVSMVISTDLGANWDLPVVVLEDPPTTYDYHYGVDGSVNGNNMAFTWTGVLDDDEDWEVYVLSAQSPEEVADFNLITLTEISGVDIYKDGSFPSVEMTDDELFVTVWEENGNENIWSFHSVFTNDGFVPDDQIAPVITPDTPQPITIYLNEPFEPLNYASAVDETDGDLSDYLMVEVNGVNTAKTGLYTVTYQVVDMAMNLAETDIEFFVKKKSSGGGGGSISGSSAGSNNQQFGQQNTAQTLEDVPPLFDPTVVEPEQDITGMFDDIFKSRLGLDGQPVPEGSSPAPASGSSQPTPSSSMSDSNISQAIQNFFTNLFGGFFN